MPPRIKDLISRAAVRLGLDPRRGDYAYVVDERYGPVAAGKRPDRWVTAAPIIQSHEPDPGWNSSSNISPPRSTRRRCRRMSADVS